MNTAQNQMGDGLHVRINPQAEGKAHTLATVVLTELVFEFPQNSKFITDDEIVLSVSKSTVKEFLQNDRFSKMVEKYGEPMVQFK